MTDGIIKATPEKIAEPEQQGWLLKWTNYIKGYQRRWFVLQKGVLSYYRNQSEMNHACRGTISLHGALIHTVDSCTFVISNGGTQTFHIKAANEVERQSWVTALELAKAKAILATENDDVDTEEVTNFVPSKEINVVMRDLNERLENLRTCYDLISKHGVALQRALNDLESNDEETLASRTKIVNERSTLFKLTANAMVNACSDFLRTAELQGLKWTKMLSFEREQRQRLEDIVEQVAKQQSQMEQAVQQSELAPLLASSSAALSFLTGSQIISDDELEFFDAEENADYPPEDGTFMKLNNCSIHLEEQAENKDDKQKIESNGESNRLKEIDNIARSWKQNKPKRVRRTRVPDKPNYPLNLWSIMKTCIGKDLSRIPMPVNFNEPLSMLQRLVEDYEYSDILNVAAQCTDACEQLAYIAAFTASAYSTTTNRTGKPFNPLLGETYECDRTDDFGWRCIAEQVSHHPPIAALHCESRDWNCWQELSVSSKFRGKYVQVIPQGSVYAEFPKSGNKYRWHKVTTIVNNIIVGKLWVDQQGDVEIRGLGAAEGLKCILKYVPYTFFSRDAQRQVKGVVMDRNEDVKWVIRGAWDGKIEIAPVLSTSGPKDSLTYKTGPYKTVWTRQMPPPDSEKYYNFTLLACQLNEMEEGVAPTDSRLRPDQRLMENAQWDESNAEKLRLEEKQRLKRLQRDNLAENAALEGQAFPSYEPIWFKSEIEESTGDYVHKYQGRYWEHKEKQDWSPCPNIF